MVEIVYRWHPLHGERLRPSQRSGRGSCEILYLEARVGISREVPAWMCDVVTCAAMVSGPAEVGVEALIELRALFAARAADSGHASASDLPTPEEADDAAPTPDAAHAGAGTPKPTLASGAEPGRPGSALADLLLEALGARAVSMSSGQEASDEPQDYA